MTAEEVAAGRDVVVDLRAHVDDEDDESTGELWWSGEWGIEGESVGYAHSTPDLAELVETVVEHTGASRAIRWVLHDEPGEAPLRAIVNTCG